MACGLLFECDDAVAAWTYDYLREPRKKFDKAVGIVDNEGCLVGGILFQNWNGPNLELSYYGHQTMTLGIVRCIARILLSEFDVARVTVITSKKNRRFMRGLCKIGFKVEGIQRCYYGKRDCNRNTGVRFVAFRDQIEKVAKYANGPTPPVLASGDQPPK